MILGSSDGMPGMPGMSGPGGSGGLHLGARTPIDLHSVLTAWMVGPFAIGVAVACAAAAAWYLVSVRRLQRKGRRWPLPRTLSFLAGLLAVEVALGSSVATLSGESFGLHVVQHLLLMIIAPPLGAMGAPMTLLLQTSRRSVKRVALGALHSPPFRVLSHGASVFFLYYLSMYAFFLTPAIGWAMQHMWGMDLINLAFLGGATLFWWPMVSPDPDPRGRTNPGFKVINLLVGVPVESFLGIALLSERAPVAPVYTLAGTHFGGGLFWGASEIATLIALGPIFVEWSRSDARAARRFDARLDAGEELTAPVPDGVGMAATLRSLRRG